MGLIIDLAFSLHGYKFFHRFLECFSLPIRAKTCTWKLVRRNWREQRGRSKSLWSKWKVWKWVYVCMSLDHISATKFSAVLLVVLLVDNNNNIHTILLTSLWKGAEIGFLLSSHLPSHILWVIDYCGFLEYDSCGVLGQCKTCRKIWYAGGSRFYSYPTVIALCV